MHKLLIPLHEISWLDRDDQKLHYDAFVDCLERLSWHMKEIGALANAFVHTHTTHTQASKGLSLSFLVVVSKRPKVCFNSLLMPLGPEIQDAAIALHLLTIFDKCIALCWRDDKVSRLVLDVLLEIAGKISCETKSVGTEWFVVLHAFS